MLFREYAAITSGTVRMDVVIIANDLTGAADSGVQWIRYGYRTVVIFHEVSIPTSEDLDAVRWTQTPGRCRPVSPREVLVTRLRLLRNS